MGSQTVAALEDEASYNRDVGARVQHPIPPSFVCPTPLNDAEVVADGAPISLPSGVRLPPPKLMPVGTQTGATLQDEAEFGMEFGASQLTSEQLSALGFIG